MWQGNEERVAQAYDSMNRFLAAFFQHVSFVQYNFTTNNKRNIFNVLFHLYFQAIRDLDYEVKEKAFLEKLLDIELADVTEKAILFTGL